MPGSPFLTANRPRLDPGETTAGLGRENARLMTASYHLPLDLPLLDSELLRHDLSEARGILWGAGLGVVVWTGLLYLALGT